jgi:hypothetical protein
MFVLMYVLEVSRRSALKGITINSRMPENLADKFSGAKVTGRAAGGQALTARYIHMFV